MRTGCRAGLSCGVAWPQQTRREHQAWLPQVHELIHKVRTVFVETLDELNWMDDESKHKAREKVGQGGPHVRRRGPHHSPTLETRMTVGWHFGRPWEEGPGAKLGGGRPHPRTRDAPTALGKQGQDLPGALGSDNSHCTHCLPLTLFAPLPSGEGSDRSPPWWAQSSSLSPVGHQHLGADRLPRLHPGREQQTPRRGVFQCAPLRPPLKFPAPDHGVGRGAGGGGPFCAGVP